MRYRGFTGGIDLAEEKRATLDVRIAPWARPARLNVPLAPHDGTPAKPIVQPGQVIAAGEVIAEGAPAGAAMSDSSQAVPVFAPVAGRVRGRTTCSVAVRGGFIRVPAVEIEPASAFVEPPAEGAPFDWRSASPRVLRERLAGGGLVLGRPGGEDLSVWIERARRRRCRLLIANAMEGEPYVTCDHRLLAEHGLDVILGLAILSAAAKVESAAIAVDHRRTDAYRALVPAAREHGIERVALPHKYPTGVDAMLAMILTGGEIPPGGGPMDVGAAVVDPSACRAAYRWVAFRVPSLGRVVTVAGERATKCGNFLVPFGMPCGELLAGAKAPWIHGGPMTGLACPTDAVVGPATGAVLAIQTRAEGSPSQCIRCSWCTDHCPARLNVAALNDFYELAAVPAARRLGAAACIGCGVCSYVCPAGLPLTQRVRELVRASRAQSRGG